MDAPRRSTTRKLRKENILVFEFKCCFLILIDRIYSIRNREELLNSYVPETLNRLVSVVVACEGDEHVVGIMMMQER
jgi:hypothetical protein